MTLTPEEKAERTRKRMVEKAREYSTGTYIARFVAPIFQKMIRAEAGARPDGQTIAIVDGEVHDIGRFVGECVCVTCGKVEAWSGGAGGMNTGHFIASRRNSILFEEDNVAPQCCYCNIHNYGQPLAFARWMLEVRGKATVERLKQLKYKTVSFTREDLVDMRIEYDARLKAAKEKMKLG